MPISPDTKNWTWVLERPCDECGFASGTVGREQVGAIIRANAASWQQHLAAGPAVTRRPSEDKWSTLEYGCHVRDVLRIMYERLDRMLAEADPVFANWDQDATALADRYDQQDPLRVAGELDAAAARLADRFDSVPAEEWGREGTRSDGAHFTVQSLARYAIHDVSHHVWDVTAQAG